MNTAAKALLAAMAVAVLPFTAMADTAMDECLAGKTALRIIVACSPVIEDIDVPLGARALAHARRGQAHADLGQDEAAIADFTKVIELQPGDGEGYMLRGLVYARMGKLGEAVADFTQEIAVSGYGGDYYRRAALYIQLGDLQSALEDLDEAVGRIPADYPLARADAHNARAWAYYLMGNFKKGWADADRAIELDPELAEAYDTRAHIFEKMPISRDAQDSAQVRTADTLRRWAIWNYRKALELKPGLQGSIDGLKRLGVEQ
jgi:tetratricopeptide (TPR) repeat protein